MLKPTIQTLPSTTSQPPTTYHYTKCQKKGSQMGFKHSRILILNEQPGTLYYINQPDKWPQNMEPLLSKPKNQKIFINVCEVRKEKNGKEVYVMYNKGKQDKGEVQVGEWCFVMESQEMADMWVTLVKDKKVQRTAKAISDTPKSSTYQPLPNDSSTTNNNNNMLQSSSKQPNNPNLLSIPPSSNITTSNKNTNPTTTNPNPNTNTNTNLNTNTNTTPNTNTNMNTTPITNTNTNTNSNMNTSTNAYNANTNNSNNNNSNLGNTGDSRYMQDSAMRRSSSTVIPPKNPTNTETTNNPPLYTNTNTPNKTNPTTTTTTNPTPITTSTTNLNNPRTSTLKNQPNIRQTYPRSSNITDTDPDKPYHIPPPTNTNTNVNTNVNTNNNNNTSLNRSSSNVNSNVNLNRSNSNSVGNNNSTGGRYVIKQETPKNITNTNSNSNINKTIDWNLKFLQSHTQQTISDFSNHALQTFLSLSPQTLTLRPDHPHPHPSPQQQTSLLTKNGINFYLASYGTKTADQLNREFKNYHYILEACRESRFINVPLCCVIEYLGIFCLAKAGFLGQGEVVRGGVEGGLAQQLRTLELYTKISSESIKKTATIMNLSKSYQKQGNFQRIYIDNLVDYLPSDPQSPQHQIRPQLLQPLTKPLNPKHPQSLLQLTSLQSKSLQSLSQSLSQHENILTSYTDIKQLLHEYGLNQTALPGLYNSVRSRFTKKYIYTVMVCRIVRESVMGTVMDMRENGEIGELGQVVEEVLRVFCEGDRGDQGYRQVWNNTAQDFKKQYRMSLHMNEIEPGFFLSTLLTMMSIQFNIKKLDKSKSLMSDTHIINHGFFIQFKPTLKTYHKFVTESTIKIMNLCQTPTNNLIQLSKYIDLSNPSTFPTSPQHQKSLLCHLSTQIPPQSPTYPQTSTLIYSHLNLEPPTLTSHSISLNYADHCLKQSRIEDYKLVIENCIDIINYWLGDDHVLLCDVFQSLAQYYEGKGAYQDCVNYMKQALTTCVRLTGTHTYRVGLQYFRLAEKQLKYGEAKEALQNYYKAKQNIQSFPTQSKQYPIILLRIANLQLSQNNTQKCIILCIKSLKQSQQKPIPDTTSIKIYELLSRAYELNTNKQQLLNLAHLTAKFYNSTMSSYVFDQMVRICLVGFVMGMTAIRQDRFLEYLRVVERGMDREVVGRRGGALERLMLMARGAVVMERFWRGLEGVEKWVSEVKTGRTQSIEGKEFRSIVQLIVQIVGKDFIEGILNQAKYW